MERKHKDINSEIIDKLIEEYYSNDCNKMDTLVRNCAAEKLPQDEIDKIIGKHLTVRYSIKNKLDEYENQIVKMLDVATILSDVNCVYDEGTRTAITEYLIEKNKTILPDIIEIIQLAKK